MDAIPLWVLFCILILMLVLSAFFSGSETGLMTVNRYRMKHMAKSGHGGAKRAADMLEAPDKLIGLILLGNNLVNIIASSLATVIGIRLYGDFGVVLSTIALTIAVLVFSEVTPKTLSALYPERIAYPAAYVYKPLLQGALARWCICSIRRGAACCGCCACRRRMLPGTRCRPKSCARWSPRPAP